MNTLHEIATKQLQREEMDSSDCLAHMYSRMHIAVIELALQGPIVIYEVHVVAESNRSSRMFDHPRL